ncbi:MAG: dockerin type I repeat-containing protein [Prevotella sp.]|nr:dockerin type I repeat-containing protein [Prevotella sp.]
MKIRIFFILALLLGTVKCALAVEAGSPRTQLQLASSYPGDVNGDRAINVTDVTMLVNYILGNSDNNFVLANADVNGDEEVTVTDVTALVNLILTGSSSSFTIDTNLDDDPITFGGGGNGPARSSRK